MNAPEPAFNRSSALTDALPTLEDTVLRCLLSESIRLGERPLIRGLSADRAAMLAQRFGLPAHLLASRPGVGLDEFDELFALLREHASPADAMSDWLAAGIAGAAQRDRHLWQDMGLPSRAELSMILLRRFPSLALRNVGDMKWKKFFYRTLCEREGVPICKSPNCADCCDYRVCFGPEC